MDSRIIRILNNGGYEEPTILQKSIIPLALQGKNIIAETDKGAGKIASYIIPSIISLDNSEPGLKILVIASSVEDLKEISEQFKLFMGKDFGRHILKREQYKRRACHSGEQPGYPAFHTKHHHQPP